MYNKIKLSKAQAKDHFTSFLFVAPAMAFLVTFALIPIIYLLYLSFFKYQIPNPAVLVGLDNYTRAFGDALFWKSLKNTLLYTVGSSTLGLSGALAMAVFLNRKFAGKRFFKVMYFLPTVTSEVITAMIFLWIFDGQLGILNYGLRVMGNTEPPQWLLTAPYAMLVVMMVGAWRGISYNTPIYLAALEGIPKSLYEAADIDGANGWQKFWNVSVPGIVHTLVYTVVMAVIGSFQVVAIVDVLTNGGPLDSTLVAIKYIWKQAFEYNNVGYGATLSLLIVPFLLIFTVMQLKISKRRA